MTNLSNGLVDQVSVIKEKLRKHIENGEQALIVEHNIYVPDSATKVTLTQLYTHFVYGYVLNKATGEKMPYTITYNSLICHDFDDRSCWEDGSSLYD